MKSLIVLLLLTSTASAQRFSNIDLPNPANAEFQVKVRAEGFDGGQGSFSITHSSTNYELYTDVSVDDSQNAVVHQVVFLARGRLSFDTHDSVYIDYQVNGSVERTNLDLNPIPNPMGNVFGVLPFRYTDMTFGGTYHNRSFSKELSVPLLSHGVNHPSITDYRFLEGNLGLGFSDFPSSLALVNETASGQFDLRSSRNPLLLEPFFKLSYLEVILPEQGDLVAVSLDPVAATARVVGDSNRDGVFDSSDLVSVFTAGQYEDAVAHNSTWSTGDWNLDTEFDTRDLVVAFQAGSYSDRGAQAAAVPESTGCLTLLAGMILFASKSRHRFMHVRR